MGHDLEFTSASFQSIAVLEARKGRPDPGARFSSVKQVMAELKVVRAERRTACAGLWANNRALANETYAAFQATLSALQEKKRAVLAANLDELSSNLSLSLSNGVFRWGLRKGPILGLRETYAVSDSPTVFFARKQLEQNLQRAFGLKPLNRNSLVAQLRDALEGELPMHVYRTDVLKFYESLPHNQLRSILQTRGLSATSRELIEMLLQEWAQLTGRQVGLPTGVGISAHLAEIYAQEIDREVLALARPRFYGRYVDDIVIVTASKPDSWLAERSVAQVLQRFGLRQNWLKRRVSIPAGSKQDLLTPVDFLGYSLTKRDGAVSVALEERVRKRYENRVRLSFSAWEKLLSPTTGHEGLLLDRIRFLTGNTKLTNSKGRAFTGIYFNHPVLNSDRELLALDSILRDSIKNSRLPSRLKRRLRAQSFASGFKDRAFHLFSQDQLKRLVVVWNET